MPPPNAKTYTLLIGLVVVVAVVSADLGLTEGAFRLIDRVPGRDLTGHFVLFAALSLTANAWLASPRRPGAPWRTGRVVALLAALVALEELSQAWIPARTFSLADLAASLLGVAAGAAAARALARVRKPAPTC
jgi:polysaccharide biosynthesis protein VpsQ